MGFCGFHGANHLASRAIISSGFRLLYRFSNPSRMRRGRLVALYETNPISTPPVFPIEDWDGNIERIVDGSLHIHLGIIYRFACIVDCVSILMLDSG